MAGRIRAITERPPPARGLQIAMLRVGMVVIPAGEEIAGRAQVDQQTEIIVAARVWYRCLRPAHMPNLVRQCREHAHPRIVGIGRSNSGSVPAGKALQ